MLRLTGALSGLWQTVEQVSRWRNRGNGSGKETALVMVNANPNAQQERRDKGLTGPLLSHTDHSMAHEGLPAGSIM